MIYIFNTLKTQIFYQRVIYRFYISSKKNIMKHDLLVDMKFVH
jgi:hypothetical protein